MIRFFTGVWAQMIAVCWTAVFIWLIAFALFPSRDEVVESAGATPSATPSETAGPGAAAPSGTPALSPTPEGTRPPCRDSFEPYCGQFRWAPTPKNDKMTLDADVTSGSPKAGEPVTVSVTARDDTTIVEGNAGQWGDGTAPFGTHAECATSSPGPARYGPWTPPEPEDDTYEFEVEHTYGRGGSYEFVVQVSSGDGCGADIRYPNPYGEVGQAKLKIVVSD